MANNEVFQKLEKMVLDSSLPEDEKSKILKAILRDKDRKANLMITGATGSGKSSTINALFGTEKAIVGTGPNPETMHIEKFELGNLVLWDSPGLGDGKEKDQSHSKGIIEMLHKKDDKDPNSMLIDAVLVILDGASRDLGTSYELINKVIIPNMVDKTRIIIGINQADQVMKGRYWDSEKSQPQETLLEQLEEKAQSVKKRVKEATDVDVEPVYYSAGFKEKGLPQEKPYNLSKLLCYIIESIPKEKRLPLLVETNKDTRPWESNDGKEDYGEKIKRNVGGSVLSSAGVSVASGAALGAAVGSVIPVVGTAVGAVVGAVGGAIVSGFRRITSGCYITTATCRSLGRGDSCYELNAFRSFRDNWLAQQPDGKAIIEEYYQTAPGIVASIDAKPDSGQIYAEIWQKYLAPCLDEIEHNRFADCKSRYMDMVQTLQREYTLVK
ncbi:MAG: 50S ribosome-binding GTPase [Spirochaetes bacterium]|nr:50S ribosome-binding GTPase [Spirochaetota bacterium]